MRRTFAVSPLPLALLVAAALVAPASAQDAPTCLSKQLKLASKACKSVAKCYVGVIKAGSGDAAACLDAAQAKLADKLAGIESKGGCTVEDAATGTVGDLLANAAADAAAALTLTGGKCAASKTGAFGKRCAAELKCHSAAAAASSAVDPTCIDGAADKFDASFLKADDKGGCVVTGDSAAVAAIADDAVSETVAYLSGLGTTTLPPPTTTTIPPPDCAVASDCPGTDTECHLRMCASGVCGFYDVPAGTPLSSQTPGDCREARCDGAGNITSSIDDGDLPDDGNACTSDACVSGTPTYDPLPLHTSCGGNWTCDGAGTCAPCTVPALDCTDPIDHCFRWTCAFTCQAEPNPDTLGQFDHDFVAGDCMAYFCGPDGWPVEGPDPTDGASCEACAPGTEQTAPGIPPTCRTCSPGEYCAGGTTPAVSCGTTQWDHDSDPATPCVDVGTNCNASLIAPGPPTLGPAPHLGYSTTRSITLNNYVFGGPTPVALYDPSSPAQLVGDGTNVFDASAFVDPNSCDQSHLHYRWLVAYIRDDGTEVVPYADQGITGYLTPTLTINADAMPAGIGYLYLRVWSDINPAQFTDTRIFVEIDSNTRAQISYYLQCQATNALCNPMVVPNCLCFIPALLPTTEPFL